MWKAVHCASFGFQGKTYFFLKNFNLFNILLNEFKFDLQAQASKFVQKFHTERKVKLSQILDTEKWKQAEVPSEFQALVTYIHKNECFPYELIESDIKSEKFENVVFIGEEKYAVVGTVLVLIHIIHEYCR